MNRRLWIVSELYYPEDGATGHLLTQIAEALAQSREVSVLCAQPYYTASRPPCPARETRNRVRILRVRSTRFPKDRLLGRAVNSITVAISLFVALLARVRPGDQVMFVTNPPLLPFVSVAATALRRAGSVLIIHDIYPDVFVPTGFLKPDTWIYRAMNATTRLLYQSVDRIVTIGRDMAERVIAKDPRLQSKTTNIPNWADLEEVRPIPELRESARKALGLEGRFVVQYSGNMGLTHELEAIAQAAKLVEAELGDRVHWMMCGSGGGRQRLEKAKADLGLRNMTIHDPAPRDLVARNLNAADVAIISFKAGMAGVSVPSRMYNALAAGLPILGMCDPGSELARVIEEDQVGWVVPPGRSDLLAQQVVALARDWLQSPDALPAKACRTVAESKYSRARAIAQYAAVLDSVQDDYVRSVGEVSQ